MKFSLRGKVWLYPGEAAWYFVTVNKKVSREIKETFGESGRGFGEIRVAVAVGRTKRTYLLPIKAQVRKRENVREGIMLSYSLTIQP